MQRQIKYFISKPRHYLNFGSQISREQIVGSQRTLWPSSSQDFSSSPPYCIPSLLFSRRSFSTTSLDVNRSDTSSLSLNSTYWAKDLAPSERKGYRAAGVLLIHDRKVLMGSQRRSKELTLNIMGGKIDPLDRDPEHTATRELWEESGKLGDPAVIYYFLRTLPSRQVLWYLPGKFALFVLSLTPSLPLPHTFDASLPSRYRSLPSHPTAEMEELHWIPLEVLLPILSSNNKNATIPLEGTKEPVGLYHFSWNILRTPPLLTFLETHVEEQNGTIPQE